MNGAVELKIPFHEFTFLIAVSHTHTHTHTHTPLSFFHLPCMLQCMEWGI